MDKLISMTSFVEKKRCTTISTTDISKVLTDIFKYEMFLKQPLTIGMFVPVSVHGTVLNQPINYSAYEVGMSGKDFSFNFVDCQQYHEAKERCILNKNSLSLDEIKTLITLNKTVEFSSNYHYEKTGNYLEVNRELFRLLRNK